MQHDTPIPRGSLRRNRRTGRLTAALVAGLWVLGLVALVPLTGKLADLKTNSGTDQLPASAESTRVAEVAAALPGGESFSFLVVYHRPGGLTGDDRAAARRHLATLSERYTSGEDGHAAKPDPNQRLIPSRDGTTALFPLAVAKGRGEATDIVADLRATVADHPPGLVVLVTGQDGVGADLVGVFANIDFKLLLATVAVVAILLILTYRSPLLWIVPLLSVGCASLLSMALVYVVAKTLDLTVTTQTVSILQVLIFGTGTDYALLIVARYREELHNGSDVPAAMSAALRTAGPAVVAAAATVVAGLLCLLAADVKVVRGLGPIAAVGVACALAVMTTLFPALLVLLGRRVFWPKVPRSGTYEPQRSRWWDRLGSALARRPWAAVLVSVLALGALAVGLRQPSRDLGAADSFTSKPESVAGFELLAQRFPEFGGKPLTILTRPPRRDQVLAVARETPGIQRAQPGRLGTTWAEIIAFPVDAPDTPRERDTIQRLRDRVHAVNGADAIVGGGSAGILDAAAASKRDRRVVMPLVLAVVVLILMLLLRALVVALLLIATVVLSFAASTGASLLIFKHLFGFPGLGPTVPLFGFLFLVALGVDYNIFLMSRAWEEAQQQGTRPGMATALTSTGGVITSAGMVLAATFAVLAMLPLVFMVEVGFLVAFGVLLDTFVVRSVLVPALTFGLGRHIWWPGSLSRPDPGSEGAPWRGRVATRPRPTDTWAAAGASGPAYEGAWADHKLHNLLAQCISSINLQADIASLLEAHLRHQDPVLRVLGDRLRDITEASRIGMVELGAMRDRPGSWSSPGYGGRHTTGANGSGVNGSSAWTGGLDALAARIRSIGTGVWVNVLGEPRRLPSSLDAAAYRFAEDVLVNMVGQTPAREVQVDVEYGATALRLVIKQEGAGGLRVEAVLPFAIFSMGSGG